MIDLAIIGAGPAGMSAAVYAARYLIDFKLFGQITGGLVSESHAIENYLTINSITGKKFTQKCLDQLNYLNVNFDTSQVKEVKKEGDFFKISFDNKEETAKYVLLAIGTKRKKLIIPGEAKFLGRGVSYCATCDAFFFKNKTVAVIGGSDSAVTAAIYLADIADKVYIIYRKTKLRAEPAWIKKAEINQKIEIIYDTNALEIIGTNTVEGIVLDKKINESIKLDLDGVFIEIGTTPNIAILNSLGVETDEKGYVVVDAAQKTSSEGIWAAGDITTGSNKLRQIITAAAEGAVAVSDIYGTLKKK